MANNFASRSATPAASPSSLGVCAPGAVSSAFQPRAAPAVAERQGAWPVLTKGTLVKVGISWLRDHTLVVVIDPGPARRRDRRVMVRRCESERHREVYGVRRDNISLPRDRE
jgi:hypothetical protein